MLKNGHTPSFLSLYGLRDPFLLSPPHLHSSSVPNGHSHTIDADVHRIHVADFVIVEPVLIGHVDLVVWHTGRVARFGHQIRAVAHEVILPLIKGGVVGITGGNAGGGACG